MANLHGLLVLDKPQGLTSRAALDRAQQWFPRGTRLGHTGTLDPLATGVLVVCVGVATRLTEYVQDMDKVYRAGILLGATSTTDDADGEVSPVAGPVPGEAEVRKHLETFVGAIDQIPPNFSAAKVTGRRAYDLARRGQEVTLAERKVRIDSIELLRYDYPHLDVEVRCGKGTYIRSLARDLGERLGCGGLIESLRRLRVGCFTPDLAPALDAKRDIALGRMLPLKLAVQQLPQLQLTAEQLVHLRQGRPIAWSKTLPSEEMAVFDPAGELAGIVEVEAGRIKPSRMLSFT